MRAKEHLANHKRWQAGFWLVTATLGVCSCVSSTRPAYPPPVSVPEAFSATGEADGSRRWWTALDDAGLDALMERALSDNLGLQAAWERLAQARATARKQGAGLFPSLDGSASASQTARRAEVPLGRGTETTSGTQYRLGLNASYVVDVWNRVGAGHEAAQRAADASVLDVQATALALSAQVAGTWYRLIEQRAQLDVLARQIESTENTLELVEMRFRKGQVPGTDVLRQRQLLESVRTERASVENGIASLEHQLAVLAGRAPGQLAPPEARSLPVLPPQPRTGTPSEWLRERPDIRAAHLRVLSQDRSLAAALADQYPSLRLSATAESAVPSLSDLLDQWAASLAGSVAAPIFAGGRRQAEVDRSRAALAETVHHYGRAILDGLREVEDALSAESAQRRRISGLERQLELSHETLNQLRAKYRNGTTAFIEVLNAEQSHQRLQRTLLTAQRTLIERRIDLHAALGRWHLPKPSSTTGD